MAIPVVTAAFPALVFLVRLVLTSPVLPWTPSAVTPSQSIRRTTPEIGFVDLSNPSSTIGLSLTTEPECNAALFGVPMLWSDCVRAYNSMEEEPTGRLTGYVGNAQNMALFGHIESSSLDFLGVPRMYWHGTCVIDIGSKADRAGEFGTIMGSDIAHKNAIKMTAASVLTHCVRRAKGGGYDIAGQYKHLRISALSLEKVQGTAIRAINSAKRQGYNSAVIYFPFNQKPPNIITTVSKPSSPDASSSDTGSSTPIVEGAGEGAEAADDQELKTLPLPVTACLDKGSAECGRGVQCKVPGPASPTSSSADMEAAASGNEGGLSKKTLWGAIIEAGICDWTALQGSIAL